MAPGHEYLSLGSMAFKGYVSQGYMAIKATGGGHSDSYLKGTRLSRPQEWD